MKAVILAGGLGTRLRPFTQVIPKPLLPIGEKSVLEIQLGHLKAQGFEDVIIATNYRSEMVESYFGDGSRWGVRLRFSKETQPLGTAGPLALLRDNLDEPFLVLNGDILTNMDYRALLDQHRSEGSVLTVASKQLNYPLRYGNVRAEGTRLLEIVEKPDLSIEVVAGIYAMSPEALDCIVDGVSFGMDQLIAELLTRGLRVGVHRITQYWLDIGAMDDLEHAQSLYETHFK